MVALLFLFVKRIFAFIDSMVVFVIKYLYQLIIAIADTNVFGNIIYEYLGRIYTFLGIFMVFKLSISMINYIVNPDALTDKSKGAGKLITNVIISLILLVVTPTLFSVAFDIQKDILSTNAIYQIVTGRALSNETSKDNKNSLYENAKTSANDISYGVYSAFIYDSNNEGGPANCKSDTTDCESKKCKKGSLDCLLAGDTVTHENNTYWWLLSTAVGIAVAYILLSFCFDIAIRSVKLGFLQIIAPIPIMLRMDPSAKDDKFSKWLKEVGSTFLSLFIRLAGLFFAIEIIGIVMNPPKGVMSTYSGYNQEGLLKVFTQLFIVIGCLMFAKKLPQLISDLFGIKLDGDGFSLKKKMGNIPGLGAAKVLGAGALGFAGGAAANVWATGKNIKNMGLRKALTGKNAGDPLKFKDFTRGARTLFSDLGGGISGAYRGATSKEKNMFKAAGAGISGAAAARNLRRERTELDADGISGWAKRTGASISNLAGIQSGASRFDKMSASLGEISSAKSAIDSYLEATNKVVKRNKAQYDAAVQKGDVEGQNAWKEALELSKNHAIANASDNDTISVLVDKYNEKVREVNSLFTGAKDKENNQIQFDEVNRSSGHAYSDLKSGDGDAKETDTSLKNDGITVGGRTWSQEHTGVKGDKK